MTGRKRHLLVDTMGLRLVVVVHPADIQESEGAKLVLGKARGRFPRLVRIWVDQGDTAHFVAWAQAVRDWVVEAGERPAGVKGVQLLPRRWVVERTFAWLGRRLRPSQDDEGRPATGEAWIHLAMIHLMLKRLDPQ